IAASDATSRVAASRSPTNGSSIALPRALSMRSTATLACFSIRMPLTDDLLGARPLGSDDLSSLSSRVGAARAHGADVAPRAVRLAGLLAVAAQQEVGTHEAGDARARQRGGRSRPRALARRR